MAETNAAKRKRLVNWYSEARATVARMAVAGEALTSTQRWDLVNAQNALAEFVARPTTDKET